MANQPPPPTRGHLGSSPPPPTKAQQLVARSGFVVYEGGRTIFDQPVLVYLSVPARGHTNTIITDHTGHHLGRIETGKQEKASIVDLMGNTILRIRNSAPSYKFVVSGTATGSVGSNSWTIGSKLDVHANGERYGSIVGSGFSGVLNNSLRIHDHRDEEIGAVRVFSNGSILSERHHHVISIDPLVTGEFRRLLVAVPPILSLLRQADQTFSDTTGTAGTPWTG